MLASDNRLHFPCLAVGDEEASAIPGAMGDSLMTAGQYYCEGDVR